MADADMRRRADEIDHAGNKDSSPWSGDLRRWAAALSWLQARLAEVEAERDAVRAKCGGCITPAEHAEARADAFDEAASLAIPVYSYDVAGVHTGIERFRKQLELKAKQARAALSENDHG
jgi:hypothetical protein